MSRQISDPPGVRLRAWLPHLALALVGIVVMLYPFTIARALPVTCRGVVMAPGDVCAKASGNQTQSYEQRAAAARQAQPVVVGVGLLVTVFGGYLAVSGYRRERRQDG